MPVEAKSGTPSPGTGVRGGLSCRVVPGDPNPGSLEKQTVLLLSAEPSLQIHHLIFLRITQIEVRCIGADYNFQVQTVFPTQKARVKKQRRTWTALGETSPERPPKTPDKCRTVGSSRGLTQGEVELRNMVSLCTYAL